MGAGATSVSRAQAGTVLVIFKSARQKEPLATFKSAIKKELLPGGLRWCLRCQVEVDKRHSNHTRKKGFTSMLIWRMKQARKSRKRWIGSECLFSENGGKSQKECFVWGYEGGL